MYFTLKLMHVTAAAFSVGQYFATGLGLAVPSLPVKHRRLDALRPINDAVILVTAAALMLITAQYPLVQGWLTAKILALIAFVVLARIAALPDRSRSLRATAWFAGLACVGYIVWLARTRQLLPWPN